MLWYIMELLYKIDTRHSMYRCSCDKQIKRCHYSFDVNRTYCSNICPNNPNNIEVGEKSGSLTVVGNDGIYIRCSCDCWNNIRIRRHEFKARKHCSRKCMKIKRGYHNMSSHPMYKAWAVAKYTHWSLCKKRQDFNKFYEDMWERPEGCILYRKTLKKPHSPSNSYRIKEEEYNSLLSRKHWGKWLRKWAKELWVSRWCMEGRMRKYGNIKLVLKSFNYKI